MSASATVVLDTGIDCPVLQKLASSSENHSDPLLQNQNIISFSILCFFGVFVWVSNCIFEVFWGKQYIQEEVCQRAFAKHGLRLGVPISYVDIGAKEPLPILKPSNFLKFIDETKNWEKLCGERNLQAAQSMFKVFWGRYEQICPNFQLFSRIREQQAQAERCCPIYIHGDEGQYYKKSAIMVLQWQGVLGKGTTKKQVEGHGVNSIGHTLRTRLLFGVMLKDS